MANIEHLANQIRSAEYVLSEMRMAWNTSRATLRTTALEGDRFGASTFGKENVFGRETLWRATAFGKQNAFERDHFWERPFWRETVLERNRIGEKDDFGETPHQGKTTWARDHVEERPQGGETTSITQGVPVKAEKKRTLSL